MTTNFLSKFSLQILLRSDVETRKNVVGILSDSLGDGFEKDSDGKITIALKENGGLAFDNDGKLYVVGE